MSAHPPSEQLRQRINEFMANHKGRVYQKIPHPAFSHLPVFYDDTRSELIEPHLEYPGGTVLDIGTNWGGFAHWLEDLGYSVTAVESNPKHAVIARELRDLCEKRFELIESSIFELEEARFDIILALNIFHHFLKKESSYHQLVALLPRLHCKLMFLQIHRTDEPQMEGAYKNLTPPELLSLVSGLTGLTENAIIGEVSRRPIYKLWGRTE